MLKKNVNSKQNYPSFLLFVLSQLISLIFAVSKASCRQIPDDLRRNICLNENKTTFT